MPINSYNKLAANWKKKNIAARTLSSFVFNLF